MNDDRRKSGFRLNGRTDAEMEAVAKASVAEHSAQGFLFDDFNPVEVAEHLAAPGTRGRVARISGGKTNSGLDMTTARAWTSPQGHADIAPSRYDRIEGDGYLTLDAPWVVPALLRKVPEIGGRILEPAAGRGHLSLELRHAGLDVASFDLHRYADSLVRDIGTGDIRRLTTLEGFAWIVTNLPYSDLEELATHLIGLGVRDRCGVALLVRTEWIAPKARRRLVHEHPHFAGAVMLTTRPRWVERTQDSASPRHNFAWAVWSAAPRVGDSWLRFAGR